MAGPGDGGWDPGLHSKGLGLLSPSLFPEREDTLRDKGASGLWHPTRPVSAGPTTYKLPSHKLDHLTLLLKTLCRPHSTPNQAHVCLA